jgi:hypothetical protein
MALGLFLEHRENIVYPQVKKGPQKVIQPEHPMKCPFQSYTAVSQGEQGEPPTPKLFSANIPNSKTITIIKIRPVGAKLFSPQLF